MLATANSYLFIHIYHKLTQLIVNLFPTADAHWTEYLEIYSLASICSQIYSEINSGFTVHLQCSHDNAVSSSHVSSLLIEQPAFP